MSTVPVEFDPADVATKASALVRNICTPEELACKRPNELRA